LAKKMGYLNLAWRWTPRPIKVVIWLPVIYAAHRLGLYPIVIVSPTALGWGC
jgi:hypothetical protein